ncbi:Phenylacetate-coenzyme A ligase [Roseobacter fucihabitans]|uniref:Phenylacetate-coenzyme A ligase n=1 Tax=Roseobacter fucihabitans TaxID=1537242 RepID=A0ABZ2BLK2_9RHOB|nr:AMP-binding protein [Roseobacter litoralis]MBC6966459.1 Phenylacetate-coenzyme A ligase [Roseobacter litoralis]
MSNFYDDLETRSSDAREAAQLAVLNANIERIAAAPGACRIETGALGALSDLVRLPVLRKSDLTQWQADNPPFGGIPVNNITHVFQSPGPIYEPGGMSHDWWRMGRFLHAVGIGAGDVVQNCFGYHLTPAGMIFESGARAVGATVLPAGTGQTELQVQAAKAVGSTAYAGTPDYLKVILDKAAEMNVTLGITRAAVGGGALFPALRQEYADRGILCLQCYATADLGNIAYESPDFNSPVSPPEGMIVDEGVIVEIVTPGTGNPVSAGDVGEVVVTSLNPDYPLVRFATGDLSAVMPGQSPCGRTNMRIKGWMGRADQTTKIKGMFVRPEQVAALVARHDAILKARVIATRDGAQDVMTVQVEATGVSPDDIADAVVATLKMKGRVEVMAPGSLPKDGLVIEDQRSYE